MADICGSVSLFPFCLAYPVNGVSGSGERIKAVGVTGRITSKPEVISADSIRAITSGLPTTRELASLVNDTNRKMFQSRRVIVG